MSSRRQVGRGQRSPADRGTCSYDGGVRKALITASLTAVTVALLAWSWKTVGLQSPWFAFIIVWLPMVWLGTVSRLVTPRLPASYHRLRSFERDGRVYELLGVRLVKHLLRRGPIAAFNPHLHLPTERTPANVAHLDQRMRDAEASHAILFVITLGVAGHAAARGWWTAAGLTLLFDVLLNGYPVMLQRYNRALLHRRFERPSTP